MLDSLYGNLLGLSPEPEPAENARSEALQAPMQVRVRRERKMIYLQNPRLVAQGMCFFLYRGTARCAYLPRTLCVLPQPQAVWTNRD